MRAGAPRCDDRVILASGAEMRVKYGALVRPDPRITTRPPRLYATVVGLARAIEVENAGDHWREVVPTTPDPDGIEGAVDPRFIHDDECRATFFAGAPAGGRTLGCLACHYADARRLDAVLAWLADMARNGAAEPMRFGESLPECADGLAYFTVEASLGPARTFDDALAAAIWARREPQGATPAVPAALPAAERRIVPQTAAQRPDGGKSGRHGPESAQDSGRD